MNLSKIPGSQNNSIGARNAVNVIFLPNAGDCGDQESNIGVSDRLISIKFCSSAKQSSFISESYLYILILNFFEAWLFMPNNISI